MATKTKNSRKNLEIDFAPMRKRHINDILQIEKASFPTPWAKISFLQELQNDLAVYTVVLTKGKVIGYAGMWLILDEAHITNVAVHPDYRRMGIGRLLMRQIILKAAVLGAARMTLEVRVSNTPACQLYEELGFSREGLRKGYYTDTYEDALIMWKEI